MIKEEQAAQDYGVGGKEPGSARENEKTITTEDEGLNENTMRNKRGQKENNGREGDGLGVMVEEECRACLVLNFSSRQTPGTVVTFPTHFPPLPICPPEI